jgi:hypothetical protein
VASSPSSFAAVGATNGIHGLLYASPNQQKDDSNSEASSQRKVKSCQKHHQLPLFLSSEFLEEKFLITISPHF